MPATGICGQLIAWCGQYPSPSAPAGENAAARAEEDRFLARFAGLAALDRGQVAELVGWKFQSMPHRRALAMRGISPGRFTIADARALAALRGLGRMPPGPPGFRLGDWLPYLNACRALARQCGLSLRQLDRALWIGAPDLQVPG